MHKTRSPSSVPSGVSRDALDLSLSGSQLSVSKRPSAASPGKFFSRSVSVSVAGDGRGKRNTLSDVSFGSSRSIKNLRRSNSTTQVHQQVHQQVQQQVQQQVHQQVHQQVQQQVQQQVHQQVHQQVQQQVHTSLSQEQSEDDYLFAGSSDGRKTLSGLRKASPDRTTWNILDDQPRAAPVHSSPRSTGSVDSPISLKKREAGFALAATFTANNRSNKGAVGNSVSTILHNNNYSEVPLTPKSSNQKPSFNNILKATANDEVSLENGSLTKSQKNFSSTSLSSNNRSPVSPPRGSPALLRRKEVTEEEAERFIQQVNQAAVTIQRWFRARRRHQGALQRILESKRKEWAGRAEEDGSLEQTQKRDEDRKRIREEKARVARLAAVQELQQKRAQRVSGVQQQGAEPEPENPKPAAGLGRKKPPNISLPGKSPAASPSNSGPVSPPVAKAKNTDSNLVADAGERSFRAVSPAPSDPRGSQCSQCSQEQEDRAEEDICLEQQQQDRKPMRREKSRLVRLAGVKVITADEATQRRTQRAAEVEHAAGEESPKPVGAVGRRKPPRTVQTLRSPAAASGDVPMSPTDIKAKNTGLNTCTETGVGVGTDTAELSFRAASPTPSNHRGSHCSQRSVSAEEPRQVAPPSRAPSKTTLTELLDTLKLLEEEPERPPAAKCYHKEKYAWIDEDGDSTSLTTDNLERHRQLSHHPALPDGGALLSEAKLQSIMSFLDEMEKSEQERPRSVTSGSHREAVLSEEELVAAEQASAAAAAGEVPDSTMRIKLELEEKKRTVNMLQVALAQQRELTVRHVKETEKELNRNLHLQKEQYESTIQRHLTFIDQLINDKKSLSERCEGVVGELQLVDQKYTKKIAQMQQQHDMVWQILGPLCQEIKKLKDLMSATEKIRREKWIDEKTKKIKEITVKGLEPEIQKLISKHKQELKKLRTLHEAELLQADDRAAQRYVRQCEELRRQLEREKEEQGQRERELAKQRYEKQLQEEELSLQQQRRRLYKEVSDEKERLAQLAARQRAELEELRRQLEENSSVAGRALREELERSREEQERRHQLEMKALQEGLAMEKQTWEGNYKKKEEAWLLSRERELKEALRRERDKEIELAIWTLEDETSKDREECERAADSRVKRLREKFEAELAELERSERTAVEKQQELRKQQMETEGELIRLQAALRHKEQELEDATQTRDKLADERRSLAEVIRREFADRLVVTEEENRRMKVEVSEVRARLRLEVERVTREKEEELAEVHQRVKSAILKKEEAVSNLRKHHEAAVKRADHLEALWEQQRRQLLEK